MGVRALHVDLRDEFRAGVVQPWLDDHAAGLTPNPCVRCNGSVRLDAMADLAAQLGAAALATGHYARVDRRRPAARRGGPRQGPVLHARGPRARDDRAAALPARRTDEGATCARSPPSRPAGRAKPDSQDLCFLAGTGRARFLERHGGIGDSPGAIVDRRGNVLGHHRGAHRFTVGQRRGLEIGGAGDPLYVLGTDVQARTVTVGAARSSRTTVVTLRDVTLHRGADAVERVKLRYRTAPVACTLQGNTLHLAEPFEGAAPGQVAVLLRGDTVVGSGTISS